MKKVVFIVSHLGSGSDELVRVLNENPRVIIHQSEQVYSHPDDLDWLFSQGHKLDNAAAIYGHHLLQNMFLTSESFYNICKFIYVIRPAKPSLNIILNKYTPLTASRYYCFRLRRICEMAKRTPGAVFLTWQNLADNKFQPIIENYLNLKDPLSQGNFTENSKDEVHLGIIEQAQTSYERYYYYLIQQNLQSVNKSFSD
jgi:hypothetical protein